MSTRLRRLSILTAVCLVGGIAVTRVVAHPPENPYDSTIFAPVADEAGIPIGLSLTASGFTAPLKGKHAPGDNSRVYVVDQAGKLWAVQLSNGSKTVMLDVTSRLVTLGVVGPGSFDERGFLGVAFHPGYASNGKFYTWTSEPNSGSPSPFPTTMPPGTTADHQNVLAEWHANSPGNPGAGATFVRELMRIDWPQFNHDAGDITFGPDGKLYVPTGDGGGADDHDGDQSITPPPGVVGHSGSGNAQNLGVALGKILRIDVDGNNSGNGKYGIPSDNPFVSTPGAVKEIWAYGLRNPFRLSFDDIPGGSGRLYVGDVGQNDIEEVSQIVKGGNYGWNIKEGTLWFVTNGAQPGFATATAPPNPPSGLIDPVAQFDTHHEGHSVIGGFIYRGNAIEPFKERYVFGEWSRLFAFPNGPDNYGRLFYLESKEKDLVSGTLSNIKEVNNFPEACAALGLTDPSRPPAAFEQSLSVLGFAQDSTGEVYILGNKTGRPFGDTGVMLKINPGP
jgi:glucose/arabinose dehydrogenase